MRSADGLLAMTRAERAAIPVMHPGRVDVIGAGALILDRIMTSVRLHRGARQRARHPRRHRMVAGPVATRRAGCRPAPAGRATPATAATPVAGSAAEVGALAAGSADLAELTARQSVCRACPRLVGWREEVAATRRKSFRDERYWGRPVPGWGDPARVHPDRRPGARRARREPDRAGLHRRPQRRLPVRRAAPVRPRQRSRRAYRRGRPAADRRADGRRGPLRAAGEQADPGRARYVRALAGRRAAAWSPPRCG